MIAVGVRPRLFYPISHPKILGLRDTQSVEDFITKLRDAKTVCVVGNGGIALELVHEVRKSSYRPSTCGFDSS